MRNPDDFEGDVENAVLALVEAVKVLAVRTVHMIGTKDAGAVCKLADAAAYAVTGNVPPDTTPSERP